MNLLQSLLLLSAVLSGWSSRPVPVRIDPLARPAVLVSGPTVQQDVHPPGPGRSPGPLQTPEPDPGITPEPGQEPGPTPSPTPAPGSGVITQIFKVVFSADTLSEALAEALESAAEQEAGRIEAQTGQVAALFLEILKPPDAGSYADISASTFLTAAALAPALFLVRLAMHHWNRMLNEDDGLLSVFGDWLSAGFLAVSAGPFLDSIVQAGWWLAAAALGEAQDLASQFIAVTTVTDTVFNLSIPGKPSMLAALFWIAGGLGGLAGVVGLAAAYAAAQAVLFVLAVVAPVVAVLAVIPQMRWMRGLWLKAAGVLAMLPVAAGGIFKAGVILSFSFGGGSLSELLIRLFWLWGAVGFLLSLAGILGKVTLSAAVEATSKLGRGAREIVSTAALALNGAPPAAGLSQAGAFNQLANREGSAFPGEFDPPQYTRTAPVEVSPAGAGGFDPAESNSARPGSPAGIDLQEAENYETGKGEAA